MEQLCHFASWRRSVNSPLSLSSFMALHLPLQHGKSSIVNHVGDQASKVDAAMVLYSPKNVQAHFWLYPVGSTSKP